MHFIVRFTDKDGRDHSARIEAEGYGEPIVREVVALGGDPENIYSIWPEDDQPTTSPQGRRYCVTVEYRTALGTVKFAPVNVRATDEDGAAHVATNYAKEQMGDFQRIVSIVALQP